VTQQAWLAAVSLKRPRNDALALPPLIGTCCATTAPQLCFDISTKSQRSHSPVHASNFAEMASRTYGAGCENNVEVSSNVPRARPNTLDRPSVRADPPGNI